MRIAVALEQIKRLLEATSRRTRARVREGSAVVAQQIGAPLQHVRRQELEPGGQGRVAPLLEESVGLLADDGRGLAPVASFDEQGERIFCLSGVAQQGCRAVQRVGADGVRQVACSAP